MLTNFLHKFPSSDKDHSLTEDYESYEYDEASLDDPGHSSSSRYHLYSIYFNNLIPSSLLEFPDSSPLSGGDTAKLIVDFTVITGHRSFLPS